MIWDKYHIELCLYYSADLRGANLHGADLRRADLRRADLRRADLRGADLRGANLHEADLRGANLHGADLRGANLRRADLRRADLHGANLRGADLRGANLHGANLHGANLREADLREADLHGADLRGADLHGADLHGANLHGANLHEADLCGAAPFNSIVPEKGSFTAYKKLLDGIIAELEIPASAARIGGLFGRKCRAEFVKVISLSKGKIAYGIRDNKTIYNVGKITRPDSWDGDIRLECTNGIHFFLTKKEAEEYEL